MRLALLFTLMACTSGEPIQGTVTIRVGNDVTTPDSGAALVDWYEDTKVMVLLGNDGFDCDTTETSPIRHTMLAFSIAPMTGEQHALVQVGFPQGTHYHLDGSTTDVTIDAIDDRVRGTVAFDTTSTTGEAISASGAFDVKRCF